MTDSNLKTPIRSQILDNNYEYKQSTSILLISDNETFKGKLNTNAPPHLSDSINPNNDTLNSIKFVAELAGNNRAKRLDSNTKKFTGSMSEDVDDWLFNIEQGFISSRIKEVKLG